MVTEPAPWASRNVGNYRFYEPPTGIGAKQGWKLHVSFTARDLEWVTREVEEVCFQRGVAFKIARDRQCVMAILGKGASRLSAGKLAAIYAGSAEVTKAIIAELEERLAGLEGSEVLTDLRVSEVPIFVRYGAFLEMFTAGEDGFQMPAFELPSGVRVPDRRGTRFEMPEGIDQPDFVDEALRQKKALGTELAAAGVNVQRVLMYSTGGGVYVGKHEGRDVLVKEARQLVGYDESNADAIDRLRLEYAAHRALNSIDEIPKVIDIREGRNHVFLRREYVEGEQLFSQAPRMRAEMDVRMFNAWADSIIAQAEKILEKVWELGWSVNDVQPRNFICTPDNALGLIDVECARPLATAGQEKLIFTLEFTPDIDTHGKDRDRNGLAAIRLWMSLGFVPPVTGKSIRFLRSFCSDWIASSPKLAEAFDHLERVGDANDVRIAGVATASAADADVAQLAASAEAEEQPVRTVEELQQLVDQSLVAGISERNVEGYDDARLDFWRGIAGAIPLAELELNDSLEHHNSVQYPWSEEGLDAYVARTSDSRTLESAVSSFAMAAALTGSSFPWLQWVNSITKVIELEELNRGLFSGLAGILMVCNKLGPRGGPEVIELASRTYEQIESNPGGDTDWSFLTGRAGTATAMLAAQSQFGLGKREDAISLLASSAEAARADSRLMTRGGLQGWCGFVAACRAALPDAAEFGELGVNVPGMEVWAKLEHRNLGLDGVGGTIIAAATLLDNSDWLLASLRDEAWRRMCVIHSGQLPFSETGDPRVDYGLYSGITGLQAGFKLDSRFWHEWMSIGAR